MEYFVHSIGPVGKIKWRPRYNFHIASCSGLVGDFSINVWDIRRPYLPLAIFGEHRNVATDIAWLQDPDRLISAGKDNLIHHNFADSSRPAVKANPVGLAINTQGRISHAFRNGTLAASTPSSTLGGLPDVVPKTPQATPTESFRISNFFTNKVHEKDLFLACQSELSEYKNSQDQAAWTDTEHIVKCAKNYKFHGATFEQLCDFNAKVCRAAKRNQVAETWKLISLMAKDPMELFDSEFSKDELMQNSVKDDIHHRFLKDEPDLDEISTLKVNTVSAGKIFYKVSVEIMLNPEY